MAKPNIFYSYTRSYAPDMHPSQLWKYNNCNSAPKVGTSVYASAKSRRTSCLLVPPKSIETYFHPGEENGIFDIPGSQKVGIAVSGSGQGYSHGSPPLDVAGGPGLTYAGKLSSNYGIVGFNSMQEPYSSEYYASLSDGHGPVGSGIYGRLRTESPFPLEIPNLQWQQYGRYLISKPLADMNLFFPDSPPIISWEQLRQITVVWIAGNSTNGGDKPDVMGPEGIYIPAPNCGFPDPSCNLIWAPPIRRRENLFVEFLDKDYISLGKVDLWKTKPDPTAEQIEKAVRDGFSVFSLSGPTFTYPSDRFTTTTIKAERFGADLAKARYFAIRQYRNTYYWDTYGVKYVKLEFNRPV